MLQNISLFSAGLTLFTAVALMVHIDLRDAKNGHINHSRALKWKILSCVIPGACFLLSLWQSNTWWLAGLISAGMVGIWFTFLFNGLWGLRVDRDWFYRSTAEGKNLSLFDRIVRPWSRSFYIAICCLVTAGITLLYILKLASW